MAAGRPREFDYDQALDQAMRVFWKKGYEGTSMPDLTEAMNMNKPSIYSSFGNKEELFRKALDRYLEQVMVIVRERLDAPTLKESIERFLCAAATSFSCAENPRGCLAVQGALVGSDESESVRLEALKRREQTVTVLKERLERAVKESEIPADTDVQGLAVFFATIVQGMAVQSASGACSENLHSVAQNAMKALPV